VGTRRNNYNKYNGGRGNGGRGQQNQHAGQWGPFYPPWAGMFQTWPGQGTKRLSFRKCRDAQRCKF